MAPPKKKQKVSLESLQSNATITVLVGKDEVKFTVPRYQIRQTSKFFKSACKGHWNSGEEETVRLLEQDPKVFGIFVVWMATKDIKKAEDLLDADRHKPYLTCYSIGLQILAEQLARCIFLGSVLQSPNFLNDVMDLLISTGITYAEAFPKDQLGCNEEFIKLVYENTAANSPLRRYIQDGLVAGIRLEDLPRIIPKNRSAWGHEFLIELMQRAFEAARDHRHNMLEQPNLTNRCKYHVHPGKPEDYTCTQEVEVSSGSE